MKWTVPEGLTSCKLCFPCKYERGVQSGENLVEWMVRKGRNCMVNQVLRISLRTKATQMQPGHIHCEQNEDNVVQSFISVIPQTWQVASLFALHTKRNTLSQTTLTFWSDVQRKYLKHLEWSIFVAKAGLLCACLDLRNICIVHQTSFHSACALHL